MHLFRSLATKKEQTHHWGESALLRQNVNCTEVVYYAAIYRTIISVRHSHSLARGNCAQNENGARCAASVGHRISVCRHNAGVSNFFVSAVKKTLSIVYELQFLPVLCPCTFSQRVFAEICTFSSEFTVVFHVFLWMSLLREIFRTTFLKNRMSLTQPRQGQTVFRTKIARPTLCAHLVYGLQQADATPIIANSGSNTAPGTYLMSPFKKDYLDCAADTLNKTSLSEQCIGTMSIWF